jgi:hypothetical protein
VANNKQGKVISELKRFFSFSMIMMEKSYPLYLCYY